MTDLQNALFKMMCDIHKICVENNIRYYIVGGTMLGAIRHHGFIPWDDDMDISMPREDYERFIHLPKEIFPDWMEIRTPENEAFTMTFAKVMNKNTTYIETHFENKYIEGIFIDIFPLDGIGNDLKICVRRMKMIQFMSFMLRASRGCSKLDSLPKKILALIAPYISRKRLYYTLKKYTTQYKYEDCKFVANTVGAYALKELTPKKYYGTPKLYDFETAKFYGVEKSDEFLKGVYGDYMKLPDEKDRVSRHGGTFIDLNLPYREYRKEINK